MQYEHTTNIEHQSCNFKMSHPANIVSNISVHEGFAEIRDICNERYRQIECQQYFYTTFIDSRYARKDIDSMSFAVKQPRRPAFRTEYQPTENFYTFALLFFSCFGVWLGLSMADFNPIKMILMLTQPCLHRRTSNGKQSLRSEVNQLKLEIVALKSLLKSDNFRNS